MEENKNIAENTVKNEENEALPDFSGATPLELATEIFRILDAKKAKNIQVLRVNDQTVITDYFVICTGNSSTQVKSLADEVEYQMGRRRVDPIHVEGRDAAGWTVLDYANVMVHVFSKDLREFYKIEKLYGDAEIIQLEATED